MLHLYQDNPVGGADYLNSLTDVNISNPEDGQMMVYDASTQTWRNVTQKSLNDLAEVTDLTDIIATGTTNATGSTIPKGTFFYLNDDLCQAKADIASGATFTLNTNYEEVTAGGLNELYSDMTWQDVTPTFTIGSSPIARIDVNSCRANDSMIQMSLGIVNNTAAKSGAGSDISCGTIDAPYRPKVRQLVYGFSYTTILCLQIGTDGVMSARLLSGTWVANYTLSVSLSYNYK